MQFVIEDDVFIVTPSVVQVWFFDFDSSDRFYSIILLAVDHDYLTEFTRTLSSRSLSFFLLLHLSVCRKELTSPRNSVVTRLSSRRTTCMYVWNAPSRV